MRYMYRIIYAATMIVALVILLWKRYEYVEDLHDEFYLSRPRATPRSRTETSHPAVKSATGEPGLVHVKIQGQKGPSKSIPTSAASQKTTQKPSSRKGKVVMVLASDGKGEGAKAQLMQAIEERQRYADKHGYTFAFTDLNTYKSRMLNTTGLPKAWMKVPVLADALRKYPDANWFWWLDQDAYVLSTNGS